MSHAKPIEQKRALGNPGKGKLPNVESTNQLEPADKTLPLDIGGAGAKVWLFVMDRCPWIAQTDLPEFVKLCRLIDERETMWAQVQEQGFTLVAPNGAMQSNPLLAHINNWDKQIDKMFSAFGFNPKDRGLIGLGEVQAKSKLASLKAAEKGQ